MSNAPSNNPLDMLQGMWNQMGFQLPGMVTPTLDEGELEKQIRDLRSVENWLRMNLSMLQMTIQNLEMQKSALGTFRSMGEHFSQAAAQSTSTDSPQASTSAPANPFFQAMNASAVESTAQPKATEASPDEATLAKAAMWPWEMMNELNASVKAQLADTNGKKPRGKSPTKKAGKKSAAGKTRSDKTPADK